MPTAILNPSRFVSQAVRFGVREGFAVDLTAVRANGTIWDLSVEDVKTELRRMQHREQLEFLAGSPPNTCLRPEEISAMRLERVEQQIRTRVQAYKLQIEMRLIHEHHNNSIGWKIPEVQSFASDQRVCSIVGPMCRWSMKALRSRNKEEFMRKDTGWLTSKKEFVDVPRRDGHWKHDRRHMRMTRKSDIASEYPASLVVATL